MGDSSHRSTAQLESYSAFSGAPVDALDWPERAVALLQHRLVALYEAVLQPERPQRLQARHRLREVREHRREGDRIQPEGCGGPCQLRDQAMLRLTDGPKTSDGGPA